jgi:hypothetical protein
LRLTQDSESYPGRWPAALTAVLGLGVVLLVLHLPAQGPAQTVRKLTPAEAGTLRSIHLDKQDEAEAGDTARTVFTAVSEAWLAEDHTMLARLVAPAGVRIAISPTQDRENMYSPSQAFYFFKSLFQTTHTTDFLFRRLQREAAGSTVHAVVDWRYQRGGADAVHLERLFFTLTRLRTGWGLAEIRAIR